jgi:hypothetical protein
VRKRRYGEDIESTLTSLAIWNLARLGLDILPMREVPRLALAMPVHLESGNAAEDVALLNGIENYPAAIAGDGPEEIRSFASPTPAIKMPLSCVPPPYSFPLEGATSRL